MTRAEYDAVVHARASAERSGQRRRTGHPSVDADQHDIVRAGDRDDRYGSWRAARPLHQAAAQAVAAHAGVDPATLKVTLTPKPELGDLAVACFAIGGPAKAKEVAVRSVIDSDSRSLMLM